MRTRLLELILPLIPSQVSRLVLSDRWCSLIERYWGVITVSLGLLGQGLETATDLVGILPRYDSFAARRCLGLVYRLRVCFFVSTPPYYVTAIDRRQDTSYTINIQPESIASDEEHPSNLALCIYA